MEAKGHVGVERLGGEHSPGAAFGWDLWDS
jgi:hypothetical protein